MKQYIHYGNKKFNIEEFEEIRNVSYFSKPYGGFWASDINAKFGWKEWCEKEEFKYCNSEESFVFTLCDQARILEINTVEDLTELPKHTDDNTMWIFLDFERLLQDWDAIEVNISNDHRLYYSLYGWDCDSILIMNPEVIREVTA